MLTYYSHPPIDTTERVSPSYATASRFGCNDLFSHLFSNSHFSLTPIHTPPYHKSLHTAMKALNVVYLLAGLAAMTSSVVTTFANAQEWSFCSPASSPSQYTHQLVSGIQKTATLCLIPAKKQLTFDGRSNPQLKSSTQRAAAGVGLALASVETGALIWIIGLNSEADANLMVPYFVRITTSNFREGSSLVVEGSFPPGSEIEINANTFTSNTYRGHNLYGEVGLFGIMFGVFGSAPQFIGTNSVLRVTSNTVVINTHPDATSIAGIGFISELKLGAGARAQVSNNRVTVTNTATSNKVAYGIAMSSGVRPTGNRVAVIVDANTVTATYAVPMHLGAVEGGDASIFLYNLTANVLIGKPTVPMSTGATPLMLSQKGVTIGQGSKYWVCGNQLSAEGSDSLILVSKITATSNGVIAFEGNFVTSHFGGTPLIGAQQEVVLSETSQAYFARNVLRCLDNRVAYFAPFSFGGGIDLKGSTSMSFVSNDFDVPASRDLKQNFIAVPQSQDIATDPSVKVEATAGIFLCGNINYNETLKQDQLPVEIQRVLTTFTDVAVNGSFIGTCGVRAHLNPSGYIPPIIPPVTTNAKPVATDAFGNAPTNPPSTAPPATIATDETQVDPTSAPAQVTDVNFRSSAANRGLAAGVFALAFGLVAAIVG